MRKGIIVEKNNRYITLLTPDGDFIHLLNRKQEYSIGQEVFYTKKDIIEKYGTNPFSVILQNRTLGVIALAVAILLLIVVPFSENDEIYAYVSLDINPSVEIGINDELKVIDIISYNDEAKELTNHCRIGKVRISKR